MTVSLLNSSFYIWKVNRYRYFKIFKPYGMLSQFTREADHPSLADLGFKFPKDVYPVGRLDHDSEGLLLLTNDPSVNKLLLNPDSKKKKTYWLQVEGIPGENAFENLKKGVTINLKGRLHTAKAISVQKISAPNIEERDPPVNYTKHPVNSWIEIVITEGKNRQVRKMMAKVGHPALRLIRFSIEGISINEMKAGNVLEINPETFLRLINR